MRWERKMSDINQLAESHIKEHEARLKHIDELMEQADKAKHEAEDSAELESLKQERVTLANHLDELREQSAEEWAEKGGPMVMWDIVASRLEKLVERIKH
jgi:DNA repair exonuclease SbcCD ATPase subunit